MPKKLIKKSALDKVSRLLFPKPKKKPVKTKPQQVHYEAVHIEGGTKVMFSPEGTEYTQDRLAELYNPEEKSQWLGITPVCQYQIEKGWPNAEKFVNVNLPGSIETEKDNWLGYIGAWEDDDRQTYVVDNLLKILPYKRPLVQGKIIKESDGEYRIIIFVSRKSLEKAVTETSQANPVLS